MNAEDLADGLAALQEADPFVAAAEFEVEESEVEWVPKPAMALHVDIQLPGGLLPRDHASEQSHGGAWPMDGAPLSRGWPLFDYHWAATCFHHQPLYFEEIDLERHGYGCSHLVQPVVSAAHFFGTVPALPYRMMVQHPQECVYTLGHYRPGECAPWRSHCCLHNN